MRYFLLFCALVIMASGCSKKEDAAVMPEKAVEALVKDVKPSEKALYVTAKEAWASLTKNNFIALMNNINDQEVVERMFKAGAAFKLKTGIEVTLESSSDGIIQIRPVGKNFTFWTYPDTIKKKL